MAGNTEPQSRGVARTTGLSTSWQPAFDANTQLEQQVNREAPLRDLRWMIDNEARSTEASRTVMMAHWPLIWQKKKENGTRGCCWGDG